MEEGGEVEEAGGVEEAQGQAETARPCGPPAVMGKRTTTAAGRAKGCIHPPRHPHTHLRVTLTDEEVSLVTRSLPLWCLPGGGALGEKIPAWIGPIWRQPQCPSLARSGISFRAGGN